MRSGEDIVTTTPKLDRSTAPRAGEELPVDRLSEYLRDRLPGNLDSLVVEQFPHGHSNLTYLLRLGEAEFVLRRPPVGNVVKSAHDPGREYRVLSRLGAVYPAAPRALLYCEDESVIGAPFYVMERRLGVILRQRLPAGVTIDASMARTLSLTLIRGLAELHQLDYAAAGLGDLGKPEGYTTRQVTGWIDRYRKAETSSVPAMDQVATWLSATVPQAAAAALIHNDYKYDNVLLDPADLTHVVAASLTVGPQA